MQGQPPRGLGIPFPPELDDAACRDLDDAELMHPGVDHVEGNNAALRVCAACPDESRWSCLGDALAWPGPVSGVWGGRTENEINTMKRKTRHA
ncbi:WhiB family transcriptional regulator [Frankia sp. Mgl5]|nr:WhiB family transcriptional regulator [Frankia sp. Mgl5]